MPIVRLHMKIGPHEFEYEGASEQAAQHQYYNFKSMVEAANANPRPPSPSPAAQSIPEVTSTGNKETPDAPASSNTAE